MAHQKRAVRDLGAWLCFEDKAGQALRPPRARTWSRRGKTPIVSVCGKGSGRVSLAGLVCATSGERPRLIYRALVGPAGADSAGAHQWTTPPYWMLHTAAPREDRTGLGRRPAAHLYHDGCPDRSPQLADRLPATRLRCRAQPDRGRVGASEAGAGQPRTHGTTHLAALVKTRLKRMQYRRDLIDGFTTQTRLVLKSP